MTSHRRRAAPRRRFFAFLQPVPLNLTRREGIAAVVLVATLIVASTVGIATVAGRPSHVAAPSVPRPPVAAGEAAAPETSGTQGRRATAPGRPFRCAANRSRIVSGVPEQICIPAIRVDTAVMSLGLNADRTVQVPPLSRVGEAGWYRYSAEPGAVGPTVILGHVDSAQYGEGVFFDLARLRAGDTVQVHRADGRTALFRIDRVEQVPKSSFPTEAVYGATSGPALRLVTCGGAFDSAAGSYRDNIIAFGTLMSLRPAL